MITPGCDISALPGAVIDGMLPFTDRTYEYGIRQHCPTLSCGSAGVVLCRDTSRGSSLCWIMTSACRA
jgi:hypothetical protein